jgi:sugar/nucleoside kinase (ribokinase family)
MVVIKQGEYGALLLERERTFYVPAFPLEEVFDPTGAGDAFAGGFMGYLARVDSTAPAQLRRAMVYGSAMGGFAVQGFGIRGFETIDYDAVQQRVGAFVELTHVPSAEPIP